MTVEREGTAEDFANLFGRDPDSAPADDDRRHDADDRAAPDDVEEPRAEARSPGARGPGEEEEPSHADLIAAAGRNPAKLARDAEFFRMLHPPEDEDR